MIVAFVMVEFIAHLLAFDVCWLVGSGKMVLPVAAFWVVVVVVRMNGNSCEIKTPA